MIRTSTVLTLVPGKYSPNPECFALFMSRWLELAGKVEKSFPFKFEWERLVWKIGASVGYPRAKKGRPRVKTNVIPITTMRVDLMRADQVEKSGRTNPISISQAFCDDIVFVSWESRLGRNRYDGLDQLAKDIVARLESTRY